MKRPSMALALTGFEWRYHTRQLAFLVAAALFFFQGVFIQGRLGGAANLNLNAPYLIAYGISTMSLLSVFVCMIFCANAALRDSDHGMAELIYAAPVRKRDFLLARFGGSFAASLAAVCMLAVGMFAATFLPLEQHQQLGPRLVGDYLHVLGLIVVPNVLLVSALLFAIATFSRSMIATYVGALLLYGLYWIGAALGGSPMMAQSTPPTAEGMALAALLDPFGISATLEQTMHWNALEKNAQLIAPSGKLLLNRLACVGLAGLILALVYWRFQFKLATVAGGRATPPDGAPSAPPASYLPAPPPARHAQWHAFAALVRLELGVVVKGFPFIAMLLIWTVLVASEMFSGLDNADGGARALPQTALLIGRFQFDMLPIFGSMLVIFYSGELVWRERALHIDALLDGTPASGAAFFAAKWVALASLPMLMIGAAIACAVAFQLVLGHTTLEPALYLSLFYFSGLPLVLTATLAMFFQVLARGKYLGMLLTGAVAVVFSGASAGIGIEHPMLHFAKSPGLAYSDMNGYGASGTAFHWYMGYWGALAALLGWAGLRLWRRGDRGHAARRLANADGQRGVAGPATALACVAALFGCAGFIFYQTNHVETYASSAERAAWRAQYEQRYRKYQDRPQPRVLAVRSKVELYPSLRRYRVEGEYRLHNRGGEPITEVLVAAGRDGIDRGMSLAGASVVERDERFGQTVYRLDRPLEPGQETTLRFALEGRRSPFGQTQGENAIDENGSILFTLPMLPHIGYNERLELDPPPERARNGLAPRAPQPRVEADIAAHQGDFSARYDWVAFDTTISTDADQIAFAPGRLEKTWDAGGRRHFHYRTDGPVRNVAAFLSGRYAISKQAHDGVSVEVYYHPGHPVNVARMRAAALASLDYFKHQFGHYPHDHLRIVEVPATSRLTGFALPGTILIGERGGFIEDLRADLATDQVTRRIAHEVGHQWWGHQVDPAPIEGGLVMVETLARYSEMRIVEQTHGKSAVARLMDFELARYLRGSAGDSGPELPLYRVQDQGYLMYAKGALAMQALTESIGAATMNAALRSMVQAHAYPRRPATSLDLIASLARAAPAQASLIEEAFKQNVRYDLTAGRARYTKLDDGRYRLTVQVQARKLLVDEGGRTSDSDIDQAFVIGVFDGDGETNAANAIYLAPHRLRAGSSEISIVVGRKPGIVAIEPTLRFIERDRHDNFVEPTEGS